MMYRSGMDGSNIEALLNTSIDVVGEDSAVSIDIFNLHWTLCELLADLCSIHCR